MTTSMSHHDMIGAVVIGRNEGQRLVNCLDALLGQVSQIVYVDSGSTDNSIAEAQARGVHCISLDLSIPFTAARARNEGASYLIKNNSNIHYIQFIDGDCELQADWLGKAYNFLDSNTEYAVVCGRRRERFPEQSIYNQLCDIEWDTPVGDTLACGGDALIRVKAYKQVNGYRDDLIAGEEPEMCFRLRELGWKIYRFDAEMTLHDAAITRFSQWWNRAKRAGYAYASSYFLHGKSSEKFKRRELFSILFWALFFPIGIVLLSLYHLAFLFLFLVYPLQILRITMRFDKNIHDFKLSFAYATSTVIAKWPQLLGVVKLYWHKLKGTTGRLIEYK